MVAGFLGGIDSHATTDQLEHIATLLPERVAPPAPPARPSSASAPSASQLAMGCDGVILHGATPAELEPIITAYAR